MENTFFQNNCDFNAEIFRRQKWLKNHPDIKADNEWKVIIKKIEKNKNYKKVVLAYNFSKNLAYTHPGLDSNIYFYHPLRVCII